MIPYWALTPATLTDLARALGIVAAEALEHKEELERYRATRVPSQ